jgi:hypothetical protein
MVPGDGDGCVETFGSWDSEVGQSESCGILPKVLVLIHIRRHRDEHGAPGASRWTHSAASPRHIVVVVAVRTLLKLGSDPEPPDEQGRMPADALLRRRSLLGRSRQQGTGIFWIEILYHYSP